MANPNQEGYDVAVIGGSIGSYVAKRLAEQGLTTSLNEKEEEAGEKSVCSGLYKIGERGIDKYLSKEFLEGENPLRKTLIENRVSGAKFHPKGASYLQDPQESYHFSKGDEAAVVVDRSSLDNAMFREAGEKELVDARTGAKFVGWDTNPGSERNLELKFEGAENIYADLLIGCDGSNSQVRRLWEVGEELKGDKYGPNKILNGFLIHVNEAADQDHVDVYLNNPGFFGWRIPRGGNKAEYGLAVDKEHYKRAVEDGEIPDITQEQYFNRLVREKSLKKSIQEGNTEFAPIPISSSKKTVSQSTYSLLLGDAAGWNKLYTGGGIMRGLIAGDKISQIMGDRSLSLEEKLEEYDLWTREFEREMLTGDMLRRFWNAPAGIQRAGFKIMQKITGGKLEKTDMDWPSSVWEEIYHQAGRIAKRFKKV